MKTSALKFAACAFAAVYSFVLFAGPEQDFDAAIKAGKPLSAEVAYKKLVQANAKVAPIVHYRAAAIAGYLGKSTQRRDRLMVYLRTEKGWSAEKRAAAWEISRLTLDAEAYLALLANEPASPQLREEGVRLVEEFRRVKRPAEVVKIADRYLEKFKDNADRKRVILPLLSMSWEDQPGFGVKQAAAYIEKYPLADDGWYFMDRQSGYCNAKWRVDYMSKNKVLLPSGHMWWAFQNLWNCFLDKDRKCDEKAFGEYAKKALSMEPLMAKSEDFDMRVTRAYANLWFRGQLPFAADSNKVAQLGFTMISDIAALAKTPQQKGRVTSLISDWCSTKGAMTPQVGAQIQAKFESFYSAGMKVGWIAVPQSAAQKNSAAPFVALLKRYPNDWDLKWESQGHLCGRGEIAESTKYMVDYALREPNGRGDVWLNWLESYPTNALPVEKKAELLLKTAQTAGATPMLKWMVADQQIKRWKRNLFGYKAFDPVVGKIRNNIKGQSRLYELRIEMDGLKRLAGNKCPPRALEILDEAVKLYPNRYPDKAKSADDGRNFQAIFGRCYWELCRWEGAAPAKMTKLLTGRVWAGFDTGWADEMLRNAGKGLTAEERAKFVGDLIVTDPERFGHWCCYANYQFASNSAALPKPVELKKLSVDALYNLLRYHSAHLTYAFRQQIFNELLATHDIVKEVGDPNWRWNYTWEPLNWLHGTVDAKGGPGVDFLKPLAWDAMEKKLLTANRGSDIELNFLRLATRAGRGPETLKRYLAWVKTLDRPTQLDRLSAIMNDTAVIPIADGKNLAKEKDRFWPFVEGEFLPMLKSVRTEEAMLFSLPERSNMFVNLWNVMAYADLWKNDEAKKAVAASVWRELARLKLAGVRGGTMCGYAFMCRLGELLKDQKPDASLSAVASRAGRSYDNYCGWDWANNLIKSMQEKELWEPLYLFVAALQPNGWLNDGQRNALTRLRATFSSKIPGIYPVSERDPAYPLYVAADEYDQNNPEKAWGLLQKNLAVFERVAIDLPPAFTVWALDQLRMDRGAKDKNLIKARDIATALLEQESKLTPETAAAMLLTRAECYRDQQNFEAAKLEYQSIRDNPTYHSTKYGKKAMFRATDLQIESGNLQGVEQTLEYWQSQNDREIQAQAHYFLAKIAFGRKDYDECIKQLKQVFAIDFTHTEGRFLQGQWKLATNNEVDDTEVLIGNLSERRSIRPGNQLTVSVQDANLSVAGGGASIPVIVKTVPGGDEERLNLYQSIRDPSNFKGLIDVVLGKASVSNRVLEVRGDDTVSYVIDPEFLKARGLPLNEPKELKVVDDAKVAMGAGAPRAQEDKTEKGVKDLLSGGGDASVSRSLRPGNPLYLVVQDRDRSMGGDSDEVKVTVRTSSGDRLEGYSLREEKPFTGVFRAKIETALPPPRAFASDTATGLNPGDVINKNKTLGWKSLSDGVPGKWLEVDTMGSHVFSNVTLTTSSAIDIKAIKLVGTMAGKTITLGQLPKADEKSKLYLRRQQAYGSFKTLADMRAFCQTDKAPKGAIVSNLLFRVMDKGNRRQTQYALYSGPFVAPDGYDSLRFRVVPRSTARDAMRSVTMWLAIDGEQVYTGSGVRLQNALVSAEVAPGCHRFELGVLGWGEGDEFDFKWDDEKGDPQPLPAEWFDCARYGVLTNFVKDVAVIARTNDGFVANFAVPTRLRTIRWVFADVKSPDVKVERMTAVDEKGETILPVASDFSDAQNNSTLEVAPGDQITVAYEDERTTSGLKKTVQSSMNSSFNNASVRFIFEATGPHGQLQAYDAIRYKPGDALVICVQDPDCDVTDDADSVEVKIENLAGQTFKKKLVEFRPKWLGQRESDAEEGMHTGVFMGVLRTCEESDTNATKNVLRTHPADRLTLSYDDRENTNPGVPCTRTAKISATRPVEPTMTLFKASKVLERDTSADARVKLERIRRRAGNENVTNVYHEVLIAEPLDRSVTDTTNAIPVMMATAIPLRVNDRSRARYAGSQIMVEAVAHSEIARAEAEGRDPDKVRIPLSLAGGLPPYRLRRGEQTQKEAQTEGTFNGVLGLSLGPVDPNLNRGADAPPLLVVNGYDKIDVSVLDEETGKPVLKRTLELVSDAKLGLTDSTFGAERNAAHVGESFYVMVNDADRDTTDEPDQVQIEAVSAKTGVKRPLVLVETMPHSGVFTGRLRPVMFAPGETIPSVSTGGVATAKEVLNEERFAVRYGDDVIFRYNDPLVLPGTSNACLAVTGTVFRGANGDVRLFSKRFSDRDAAVLVQFRLAECLFEQAKEHRKLKQPEKSAEAIADGKFLLEEALKNYPDSAHVVQGEYLLANLYQELATEAKDAKEMEKAVPLYQEALSRFSQILGTWPEGEYAARSQYHKAYCLEMLKDYGRAAEEYVKMTYLFPESELVGDATIRLATYYYTKEKRFDIAGKIYQNFQQRFPQHNKAPRALFMAGSCFIKQAESVVEQIRLDMEKSGRKVKERDLQEAGASKAGVYYREAARTFATLIEVYRDAPPVLRAQTMYWAGDVCVRCKDYAKAYGHLKRTVFEYPETEWARRARGLLLQEGRNFKDFD